MAITKDAKHPNNAHAFIDFYLRAENGARMAIEELNAKFAFDEIIYFLSKKNIIY